MGKIISFINMKGGVGKTTLSIGIADYLASINKKILIIDADPQFNATQALLDQYKKTKSDDNEENFYTKKILSESKTIYRLFKPAVSISERQENPKASELIVQLKSNLDILCGDLSLVLVNKSADHSFIRKIKNFIVHNKLKDVYDYIIIDCPPTLTIYTDSALYASDFYLIPNRIDRYSIVGIESLQQAVTNLIEEEDIPLRCLGLVYTMVEKDSAKQTQIKNDFESKRAVGEIDIFSSKMGIVKNIQYGKSGSNPTLYQLSREDIESIATELIHKIELDGTQISQDSLYNLK